MKPNLAQIRDELFKDDKRSANGGFFNNELIPNEEPTYHATQGQSANEKLSLPPSNNSTFELLQNAAEVTKTLCNIYIKLSDLFASEGDKENCRLFLKKASEITAEQQILRKFFVSNNDIDMEGSQNGITGTA